MWAADRAPDGTWSAPYVLAGPDARHSTPLCGGCPAADRQPAVTVDAAGNAVAAWMAHRPEQAGTSRGSASRRRPRGPRWLRRPGRSVAEHRDVHPVSRHEPSPLDAAGRAVRVHPGEVTKPPRSRFRTTAGGTTRRPFAGAVEVPELPAPSKNAGG